jgi:two-component system, OmpR family, response regulator MprA
MPPRYRLLVADDDQALRAALERALRFEGYAVALAADGDEVISQVRAHPPDLVVLDLAMPGTSGVEACRRLRAEGNHVPVLMLTARDGVSARVAGLDAGADDYLVKPFALQELLARLRALLRRIASRPDEQGRVMRLADLTLDGAARRVTRGGQPVELTRTEFDLLETLLEHAGQVLTRGQLFERVWGCDLDGTSNTLDVYIGYLRRKLEAGGAARLLHTVRGVGFVLREDAT